MKYIAASVLILILSLLGFTSFFKSVVQSGFFPMQFGLRGVVTDIKQLSSFFTNVSSIRDENLALRKEKADLLSQVVSLKLLESENTTLREQLGVKNTFDQELLMAGIMGNHTDLTGSTFVLDKGTVHGVGVGDTVVKGNYLIGFITLVEKTKSIGTYISSPSIAITVMDIDQPSKTEGLSEGQYGSSVLMKRILPSEVILEGDTVVTSGKDGLCLPGLIVGRIMKINETPTESLKSAYLETLVDLYSLDKVFILN